MKREALNHPKLKLLARDLNCSLNEVRGLMWSLWGLAGFSFPRGDVGRLTNEEIALAVDYEGDHDFLVERLIARRLLDVIDDEDGRLFVHDWHEHADDSVQYRLARSKEPSGTHFANGVPSKRLKVEGEESATVENKERPSKPNPDKERQSPTVADKDRQETTGQTELNRTKQNPTGLTPSSPPGDEPPLLELGSVEPVWWDGRTDPVGEIAATIAQVEIAGKKRPYQAGQLPEDRVQKLTERIKALAPGRDEIDRFFEAFADYHAGKRKPPYSDPISALNNWLDKREPDWQRLKRARGSGNQVQKAGGLNWGEVEAESLAVIGG